MTQIVKISVTVLFFAFSLVVHADAPQKKDKTAKPVQPAPAMQSVPAAPQISLNPANGKLDNDWGMKKNVTLDWSTDKNLLSVEIDPSEFTFGWFQRKLPKADYKMYSGIFGRFRVAPDQKGGRITALLILHRKTSEYYSMELGTCAESRGEWVEFFLPFNGFRPSRDATVSLVKPDMVASGDALEISIGSITAKTKLEFDGFRLVTLAEEKTMWRRFNRARIARNLKPESELKDSVHPRLLLFGKRLERIRAKAKEDGIQREGYEHLITLAEQAMKRINANDPLGKAFAYTTDSYSSSHRNRARFEGTLNPLVIPLETLASVAVITGDEKYGKYAAKALVNMAKTLDVDCPEIDQGFYYTRTFYVRSLAFGYDWLYSYMTPEERLEVKTTLLGFVQKIYDDSWTAGWGRHPLNRVWNWDPGLVSCAGLGILALQDETLLEENAMLIQFRRHLRDYLTFGIDFDGCCHEGPAYISYGIGSGVQFAEGLRDKGYGDLFTETNWHLIAPWLVSEMLPNKPKWNNLSDCSSGQVAGCPVYAYTCGRLAELAKTEPVVAGEFLKSQANTDQGLDYIEHFAEYPGKKRLSYGAMAELMGWCWNRSITGQKPTEFSDAQALAFVLFYEDCPVAKDPGQYLSDSMFFRGRGLVVSRWGGYNNEAIHFATEAGPHAAGHDQADKGTFTLRAYGVDMVIDSGYGNDGEPEKSGSSFAHNVLLIDGQGQPMLWHNNSNGEITGYSHDDTFDWVRASALDAWNYNYSRWKKEPTGMDVEKADRHYVFVRGLDNHVPPYLVTFDDYRKKDGKPHDYTWQWHISDSLEFKIEADRWIAAQNRNAYTVLTTQIGRCVGKATFTLTAPQDGKYNIAGLTRCAGVDHGKSDSFFISINGSPRKCWNLSGSEAFSLSILKDDNSEKYTEFSLA